MTDEVKNTRVGVDTDGSRFVTFTHGPCDVRVDFKTCGVAVGASYFERVGCTFVSGECHVESETVKMYVDVASRVVDR